MNQNVLKAIAAHTSFWGAAIIGAIFINTSPTLAKFFFVFATINFISAAYHAGKAARDQGDQKQ